jgi:hypothetical protein
MVDKHAVRIVAPHGGSQCGVKINPVNLMVTSAESLGIVGSPYFQNRPGLKMACHHRFGRAGFVSDAFADAKEVEGMHRIGGDGNACADLTKFTRLLEYRHAISIVLQRERRAQPADTTPNDRYPREIDLSLLTVRHERRVSLDDYHEHSKTRIGGRRPAEGFNRC